MHDVDIMPDLPFYDFIRLMFLPFRVYNKLSLLNAYLISL